VFKEKKRMSLDPETEEIVRLRMRRRNSISLLGRIAFVVSIAFCGSLALAAAVVAADGKLSGEYAFTNVSATATKGSGKVGVPAPQGLTVYVNRGLNSFQPENGDGTGTVTNSTMVEIYMFSQTGFVSGCFIIDPSDFKVSKSLQSASLHTTLTAAKACPGYGAPVTGKTNVSPKGVGGGGLALPITLDLTWTGFGVTSIARDRSSFECLDYSTESTYVSHSAGAKASGTVSALGGPFNSDGAGVSSTDSHLNISGTPNPACFSF
jgi:hypothetical protein